MVRNLLALLGLAAIGLIAAVALQANGYIRALSDDGDHARVAVSYDGLDLTVPEGVRMLERRIDQAIDRVCGRADVADLSTRGGERACRREAIAAVDPQVRAAIDSARARAGYADRYDEVPPPPRPYLPPPRPDAPGYDQQPVFAPPAEVVQPLPPEYARRTIHRRTVRTVVTTTRAAPPTVRPVFAGPAPHYGPTPSVPGSWMSPAAWRAVERATNSAFVHGRLVRWAVPGREGYVTVSAARWRNGCPCRSVRVVKYAPDRQLVVAQGTRCRLAGGLTD